MRMADFYMEYLKRDAEGGLEKCFQDEAELYRIVEVYVMADLLTTRTVKKIFYSYEDADAYLIGKKILAAMKEGREALEKELHKISELDEASRIEDAVDYLNEDDPVIAGVVYQ